MHLDPPQPENCRTFRQVGGHRTGSNMHKASEPQLGVLGIWDLLGGSIVIVMAVSLKWLVYMGRSQQKMDDYWGYPYFRRAPESSR